MNGAAEKRVMVISGFDPSAGAGILQDIKSLSLLGISAMGVVSAYTIQNTHKVFLARFRKWEEIDQELSVLPKPEVIKVGLIFPEMIKLIREKYPSATIVWNIILRSSSGYDFEPPEIVMENLAHADFLLLNNEEASILGLEPSDRIIVTGGHGKEVDKIIVKYGRITFETPRLSGRYHGTGCAFSSLFAGHLSLGYSPEEAIRASIEILQKVLVRSHEQVQPEILARDWMKFDVLDSLNSVKGVLLSVGEKTVPEVGQNVSYALPWSKDEFEVAKFPGRIRLKEGKPVFVSDASFADYSHTARMALVAKSISPHVRCVTNIRYCPEYVDNAVRSGLTVFKYDRNSEPEDVKNVDGKSMEWMIQQAYKEFGRIPDVIYDEGFWGKEAMIRIFGRNPKEVMEKIKKIIGII
jgi:predicted fused transcriptional regulator/phosphomethylpyrimidine kinase/hydroxymethylpyrimidine/phosphomethylpyrimidine kinase